MKTLTMNSTIKLGKNKDVKVSELVGIKGKIFSLIKDGYYFDEEVLSAANITHTIRDRKIYSCVRDKVLYDTKKFPKDTMSTKQIIAELNTITKMGENAINIDNSYCDNQINNASLDETLEENE